ncbi:uncharacterized protein [Diadema antillarum]|uniref:uncharacterized protein n=1 Tax=Diadema antillarum TaxID=105358 RepID=UPI003A84C00E
MATFNEVISQDLECPICLTLFNQPKELACSHTFCEDCLEYIFQDQPNQRTLKCPVCRRGTPLPSGGVGKLQTNEPVSSLLEALKTENPTCTVCEMDEKPPAVSHCQDCGKYMCKSCEKNHSTWETLSNHEVVPMSEVLSGKVRLKRRRKCKKHPNDDEDCYCIGCREYICCKCGMLEHSQAGHQVEGAPIHAEHILKNIKELKERVNSKKTTVENHIKFIATQRNEIANILEKVNDDIDKAYEECIQLLSDRKEALKGQVKRWSEKFEKELYDMDEEHRRTIRHITSTEELVTNGMKAPLENDALFAHDTLRENLTNLLGRNDPDDQIPRRVKERAQRMSFTKHVKANELCLGELTDYKWEVKADVKLTGVGPTCFMRCIAATPNGKMAMGRMGSYESGIYLYSPDGKLQQTVMEHVFAYSMAFLSDGRSVLGLRGKIYKISLYTPHWEKLDVTFETGSQLTAADSVTVDGDDNIYVSCDIRQKIQVFTPRGGKAFREIMYDKLHISPMQIVSFLTTGNLICGVLNRVICLDGNGKIKKVFRENGRDGYPAVCRDDSVIIAWVDQGNGLVSIDRYARDLEYVHNLITDFKVPKSCRYVCLLQVFKSGEIALYMPPQRFYIFDTVRA